MELLKTAPKELRIFLNPRMPMAGAVSDWLGTALPGKGSDEVGPPLPAMFISRSFCTLYVFAMRILFGLFKRLGISAAQLV